MALEDQAGGLDSLDGGVPVTETINVGGAKMPLKTVLNSDILKNLQDELDRRTGKSTSNFEQLMQGFRENAAFNSRDPSAALSQLSADKRAEQQEILNMRNTIASVKQAQALQARQAQGLNRMVDGGAGGAGGAGGGISDIDPMTMKMILELRDQGDIAGAQALLQKAVAGLADAKNKFAYNPSAYITQPVMIGGTSYDLNPLELQMLQKMSPEVRADWLKNKMASIQGSATAATPAVQTSPVATGTNVQTLPSNVPPSQVNAPPSQVTTDGAPKTNLPWGQQLNEMQLQQLLSMPKEARDDWLRKAKQQAAKTNVPPSQATTGNVVAPAAEKPVAPVPYELPQGVQLPSGYNVQTESDVFPNLGPAKTPEDQAIRNAAVQRINNEQIQLLKDNGLISTTESAVVKPAVNAAPVVKPAVNAAPAARTNVSPAASSYGLPPGYRTLTEKDVFPNAGPATTVAEKKRREEEVAKANEFQLAQITKERDVSRNLGQRAVENQQDIAKRELEKEQDRIAHETEASGTAAAKREAELMERGDKARATAAKAQELIDIANDPKRNRIFALTETNSAARTFKNIGEFIPGVGGEKAKRVIESMSLTNQEKADLALVDSHSKQIGLEAAASMVASSHLGVGVEKLALGAKGVGPDVPWQNNVRQGKMIRDLANAVAEEKDLWIDYKKNNPKLNFSDFERSAELAALTKKNRANLLNNYRGIIVPARKTSEFDKYRKPAP